ncbi:MAG: electron transfer flavoprotein subunit beta [Flexilinea sp.]|jgi:electron transfer flavoprotein beta subunit
MKILICIKQVPGTTQVDIDEKTGVLKRNAAATKMNPYDLYAIETALQIKEQYGADTTALTMGPPYSEAVLREAFSLGVDSCILLTDRIFGGADCLATSYALSQAVKATGLPDLIICGKQTTDGDTAQVGAELAEALGIPHTTYVLEIRNVTENSITVKSDLGDFTQTLEIKFPCLITVEKDIFEPRLPSYKRKINTKGKTIRILTFADMPDQDQNHYGLNGSPTRVVRVFPPIHEKQNEIRQGSAEELAGYLAQELTKLKLV